VFYGDPDFVDVPLVTLLSDNYAASRRKLVTDAASTEMRPGELQGAAERMRRVLVMAGAEAPAPFSCARVRPTGVRWPSA
jgi:gamma-glutamyltranspeptidase/glutathione hydrolase